MYSGKGASLFSIPGFGVEAALEEPQFFSAVFPVRQDAGDDGPKRAGVVKVFQVRKLMYDNVVNGIGRGHHEPPGKCQAACGCAAAPAPFC